MRSSTLSFLFDMLDFNFSNWQVWALLVNFSLVVWLAIRQQIIFRRINVSLNRKSLVLKKESDKIIQCINTGNIDFVVRLVEIDAHQYKDSKPQLLPAGAPEALHLDILIDKAEIRNDGLHSLKIHLSLPFKSKIDHVFIGEYKLVAGELLYTKSFGVIKK